MLLVVVTRKDLGVREKREKITGSLSSRRRRKNVQLLLTNGIETIVSEPVLITRGGHPSREKTSGKKTGIWSSSRKIKKIKLINLRSYKMVYSYLLLDRFIQNR